MQFVQYIFMEIGIIVMYTFSLKCQINGGPNRKGGWKKFRNSINGGIRINGGAGT